MDHSGPIRRAWTLLEPYTGLVLALLIVGPRTFRLREWWPNPDEGTYYAIATRTSGVWEEIAVNTHPPLYYWLLRLVGLVTHDFFWFRLFSVVCGIAAVYAMWLATRELAGRGVRGAVAGLVAALIVATAPAVVELSMVIRPYAMQLALLAVSLWLLLRHLRTGSGRALRWYVATLCLALLTHYSSMMAMGAFALLAAQQGLEQRWGVGAWRRMALAHLVPGAVVLGLYLLHMRQLVGSPLVDANLGGWLSNYMVSSPGESWIALMGFLTLLGAPWLIGTLAVLFLTALGFSVATRDLRPLALGGGGLGIAVLGAAVGAYPFGPTRHSIWLIAAVVPAVGWLAGQLATLPRRQRLLATCAVATLLLAGESLGGWLGRPYIPPAVPEGVLRSADMASMQDLLDPRGRPLRIVMGRQTFYLLVPLVPSEWEDAVSAADSSFFHFPLGERDFVAGTGWNLRAVEGIGGDSSYLLDLLAPVRGHQGAEPGAGSQPDSTVLVLAGGWASPVVPDLVALTGPEPLILAARQVRGLVALLLDVGAYRRAVARGRGATG